MRAPMVELEIASITRMLAAMTQDEVIDRMNFEERLSELEQRALRAPTEPSMQLTGVLRGYLPEARKLEAMTDEGAIAGAVDTQLEDFDKLSGFVDQKTSLSLSVTKIESKKRAAYVLTAVEEISISANERS